MSVTLSSITTAVDPFNDIPDITFDSIDITAYTEEVEIYTNTPAVMIPTKLNAMAGSMKDWLNDNISAPLEAQQNTFKNEVVVRTNTAMNAVETFMNEEVAGFVNTVFIPWANDAGVLLSDHANTLETNVTTSINQLRSDYTIHVESQDAIIQQALDDILANIATYTSGAADSGYSIHQTNVLLAETLMTKEISFDQYKYTKEGQIAYAEEGNNTTHHINYSLDGLIRSFGESMQITGEPRPFIQHLLLDVDAIGSTSVSKVKAYNFMKFADAGGTSTFRATGHEADGSPAEELTILNSRSVADTDNPEIIIRRGIDAAIMWDGIDKGDFVKITELDGTTIYNSGVEGQYRQDYETTIFKPYQSYCHDSTSSVTGWGVTASMNASDIDSSGGDFDTPIKCEEYAVPTVALLDDFSRSYEYNVPGESYDSELSDGLIYKVYINDDSGFIDSYAYTVDANGKQGTGAILNAVYDDGVSDVTIANHGTAYSNNTFARAFDLGAVDVTGSAETKATATHTLVDGMIDSVTIVDGGSGYTGYWELLVIAGTGAAAHQHHLQLTQAEVNTIKDGTQVTKTTVDAGHSHDITISWNEFAQEFYYTSTVGADHDHPLGLVTSVDINPTITVTFNTSTGGLAEGYVVLTESGAIDYVVMTNVGADYDSADTVTFDGNATGTLNIKDGGISAISITNGGTGYTETTAKTIAVNIQNNAFSPSIISANVGDTVTFTNLDLQAHTVTHEDGLFDSGNIPQNATFSYTITKDTELTDMYKIFDTNNVNNTATLWVRENTVYVDMVTTTGGGLRGLATVDATGAITNIAVDRRGSGYTATDTVRIIDVSGPGEGAYADVETDRSINVVTVANRGTGYSDQTEIFAFDPVGFETFDDLGNPTGRVYGSGAILRIKRTEEAVAGSCSVSPDVNLTEADCTTAGGNWTAPITVGEITEVIVDNAGSGYADVQFILNDPTGEGSGATFTTDVHNEVTEVNITARGSNYDEPIVVVADPGGRVGNSQTYTVGRGYTGTVVLNNGIGAATIVEDWADYVDGATRVVVYDAHPEPTGYGAVGEVTLGAAGNVSTIKFTNSGTAYKTPVVMVAGPVMVGNASINNVNTDLALYGPKGNADDSPFSYNDSAGTNFKNGVMIQFENPNGHTLNDSWEFKLQSWKKGTPDSLLYTSNRYDGADNNMRGIITLKDVWEA